MASLLPALEAKDGELLRPALAKLLKAELGQIELHQTAGERFTGGKSTPVWKLSFVAKRGEKEKETRLVAKWVKPTTDLRRSYVEKQFYLSAAPRVRKFCRLPHMLMCEENPESICFLFDDLTVDFPLHPENLEAAHARASLTWLARFHAYFWEADAAGGSFPAGMSGADYWGLSLYWALPTRAWSSGSEEISLNKGENEERLSSVATALTASSKTLKAHGAWEIAKTLGPRLSAAARPLDAALRKGRGFVRNRSLLHGDFKTANFFLREAEGGFEAAALDFEFSGPGFVAVDLANFLFPDLRMDLLAVERELLEFYHAQLMNSFDEFATGGDFPLTTLLAHYALARCDYMRYMLGRGWTACSAGDARIVEAVDRDLQRLDGGQALSSEGYERAISELLASS
ncbi:unnamed protein product [Effrenium voratum]|uniref:Aminoglycoside phosphotransferase domain-containing protein n=1 Tax=Effrenium voratum TaxID=2562239 RepID=A0AA36IB96_9DINO|nr:unnamed protein product [Effrenium voratum]